MRQQILEQMMRKRGVVAVIGLVVVLVAYGIVSRLPRESQRAPEPEVTLDDFVGAEACGECHAEQYAVWARSTHGRAGGAPKEVTILGKFDGSPLVFSDAEVIPRVDDRGNYRFEVTQEGSAVKVFSVDAVVGGGHMAGGGTQSYFSLFPDGTLRFLPFDFIREENTWFVQLRKGDVWVPVSGLPVPDNGGVAGTVSLDDLKNWPPNRILGTDRRFSNCQNCHGSQILVQYDTGTRRFRTRYTSLRINCESCHGPGRRHVEKAVSGDLTQSPDPGLPLLSAMSKDESLNVCFQCHATKDELKPGYLPGMDLEAYYSLKFPILGSEPYLEDGRIRSFAYQQNHLYSDCYLNGSMTCVDCHDPHSLTYRDIYGQPLEGRFDNGQCVDCHPSKAAFPERHSHHPPDSPASLCTSCHMPYLQHRGIGTHLRFARSDHTVSIPRPAFDAGLGLEGACKQCHRSKPVAWLQEAAERWYGPMKPHNGAVMRLLEAGQLQDRAAVVFRLLFEEEDHPLARMMGLSRFVRDHLPPPGGVLPPEVPGKLKRLSRSRDLDIRGLALAALDLCCGQDREVASFLSGRLSKLESPADPVRLRWALALDFLGSLHAIRGDYTTAILAYRKAHAVNPEDPAVLVNLGHAHLRRGELPEAVDAYREAIRLAPEDISIYVSLARAHLIQGNRAGARRILEAGLKRNPDDREAQSMLHRLE